MENSSKKRMGAAAALLFLSPALVATLSGCGNNCDSDHSTLTTSDDCGTGTRSRGGYFGGFNGGRSSSGGVQSGARSGGFGGFGHFFSGGS